MRLAAAQAHHADFRWHAGAFRKRPCAVVDIGVCDGADPLLAQPPEGVEEPWHERVVRVVDVLARPVFAVNPAFVQPEGGGPLAIRVPGRPGGSGILPERLDLSWCGCVTQRQAPDA